MIKHILYSFCFFLLQQLQAQESVLVQRGSRAVSLRWKGIYTSNVKGYFVYRSEKSKPQSWLKLNTNALHFIENNAQIKQIAGFKTAAWLQLFGLSENENISPQKRKSLLADSGGAGLIGLMSLVNTEYAQLLGEMYIDSTIQTNIAYFYKITVIYQDNIEKEIGITPLIDLDFSDVKPVSEPACKAGNHQVTISWKNPSKLIKSASIVTQNIYKSDNLLGPFEKVNYYGILPFGNQAGSGEMAAGSFTVPDLENGKTYYFKVINVNAFGTESQVNITLSATPENLDLLAPPDDVKISRSGNLVKFQFTTKNQYLIYRSENKKSAYTQIYPPPGIIKLFDSCYDRSAISGKTYWYYFKKTLENKTGSASDTFRFIMEDLTPPAMVTGIKVTPGNGFFKISWNKSTDNKLAGYEIERSSDEKGYTRFLLTTKPVQQTSFFDTVSKLSTTRFGYIVYALDVNNRRSLPSAIVYARMPDIVAPAAPYVTELFQLDTQLIIRWTAPTEKDIAGYRIYSKSPGSPLWEKLGSVKATEYRKKAIPGLKEYVVTAFDSSGNESVYSGKRTLEVNDFFILFPPVSGVINQTDSGTILSWKWNQASGHKPDLWLITLNANGKRREIAELSFTHTQFVYKEALKSGEYFEIRAALNDGKAGKPLILQLSR